MNRRQKLRRRKSNGLRVVVSLLVFIVLVSFVAMFLINKKKKQEVPVIPPEPAFINTLPIEEHSSLTALPLDTGLVEMAHEKYELNDDTIGWLSFPSTSLSDVVMYYPNKDDRFHYLRKDFWGNYNFNGTYFIDYRSKFEGGREGLSFNNVIYGHSMSDNPDGGLFSPLKKLKSYDFAKENPYIYFSTLEEDMAWEIFAVYVTETQFIYNTPNPTLEDATNVIETSKEKSFFDYDVEVTPEDKILTLSTCLYEVNGVKVGYPNDYRYVVMAKLAPEHLRLKEQADVSLKEDSKAA